MSALDRRDRFALLLGMHPRLGSGSAFFAAFKQNPLAAPKALKFVFDFLDGNNRVLAHEVGDSGHSSLHPHTLQLRANPGKSKSCGDRTQTIVI